MNAHYRSFAALRGAPTPVDVDRIDFPALDHEARITRARAIRQLMRRLGHGLLRVAVPAGRRPPVTT